MPESRRRASVYGQQQLTLIFTTWAFRQRWVRQNMLAGAAGVLYRPSRSWMLATCLWVEERGDYAADLLALHRLLPVYEEEVVD